MGSGFVTVQTTSPSDISAYYLQLEGSLGGYKSEVALFNVVIFSSFQNTPPYFERDLKD